MATKSPQTLSVQGVDIRFIQHDAQDFISLTDIAIGFDGQGDAAFIDAWLRAKSTVDFLGIWEKINNSHFNSVEFDRIRLDAGSNRFRLSAKTWVEKTNGIGLYAKAGRYGGTFAHKDIAFEFGAWLSPEFKLYLIKEFQHLKEKESSVQAIEWNVLRLLTKSHYSTLTDAVREYLVPPQISASQAAQIYASEADVLNIALFGQTAKEWRESNPSLEGNQRDNASIEQLIVLASLESQNALLIAQKLNQSKRVQDLNVLARKQMQSILAKNEVNKIRIL